MAHGIQKELEGTGRKPEKRGATYAAVGEHASLVLREGVPGVGVPTPLTYAL